VPSEGTGRNFSRRCGKVVRFWRGYLATIGSNDLFLMEPIGIQSMHKSSARFSANAAAARNDAAVMYVDMNSFFASCEQQLRPELRGRPIGVTAGSHPWACIIAPSIEAKKYGVKTGMRVNETRHLCPGLIAVPARPVVYRKAHIAIMDVLNRYCSGDVLPKSIDEAAINLTSYRFVYKDIPALARQIKDDLRREVGEYVKCSIGIAPNTFLAKLATDMQKPDGLVQITPENIDERLASLSLQDLPGIGSRNARRLELIGIKTPLQMRHSSQSLLRKAFGGIAGYYWHCRLNFAEVDFYSAGYRGMSATRTIAPQYRTKAKLEAMLVSLCTKLEQRLVKAGIYCRSASFFLRYANGTRWDTAMHLGAAVQDATELRRHIVQQIERFESERRSGELLNSGVKQIGVGITDFVPEEGLLYSLFDNRMQWDKLRKVMYGIKDRYGKYALRKASETVERSEMDDAIGFGSVKDLYDASGEAVNQFMLEEVDE
jgi:DNA polymerase-4